MHFVHQIPTDMRLKLVLPEHPVATQWPPVPVTGASFPASFTAANSPLLLCNHVDWHPRRLL